MESLERLLEGLEVAVTPFAICEVRGDAGLHLEDAACASLHYVLSGAGIARQANGPDIPLAAHTVVIVPAGTRLTVQLDGAASAQMPPPQCRPLVGGWDAITVGEGAPYVTLACGSVRATRRHAAGLFDYLPSPLVENFAGEGSFRQAFTLLLSELSMPKAGTKDLAETLMRLCLILFLRRQYERAAEHIPWLAALGSERLGRAITVMFDRPDAPFTVQKLADVAGMSRAAFAGHFKETFGRPPMDYLREVRLCRAAKLLTTTDMPVKAVAAQVGYTSRTYFSRAFKAFVGSSPADYRDLPPAVRIAVGLPNGARGGALLT